MVEVQDIDTVVLNLKLFALSVSDGPSWRNHLRSDPPTFDILSYILRVYLWIPTSFISIFILATSKKILSNNLFGGGLEWYGPVRKYLRFLIIKYSELIKLGDLNYQIFVEIGLFRKIECGIWHVAQDIYSSPHYNPRKDIIYGNIGVIRVCYET